MSHSAKHSSSTVSHSASEIAKYIIWKSQKAGLQITNKKLQKLLYYAQAWHLVFRGKSLFKEDIQAWVHGPAINSVYQEYKKFGFSPIQIEIDSAEAVNGLTPEELEIIDAVWDTYGSLDASYLEILTHREDPWVITRNNAPEYMSSTAVIPTTLMKEFYGKKLQEDEEATGEAKTTD